MLLDSKGKVVQTSKRGANHIEEGFVVSHKKDTSFLRPLRECKACLHHKCGDMFRVSTRFHMKEV